MRDLSRLLLSVAVGLLFFVLLDTASEALISPAKLHRVGPWHESALHGTLLASQLVVPAFIAGWLAKRHGWLIGALVGALVGALGVLLITYMSVGAAVVGPVASVLISSTARSTITGLVAGIAGSAFRNQPPNNSFKSKPLRGAA